MPSAPILSICISTFNRARYIGETVESIVSQLSDSVELVVLDGASPDDCKITAESTGCNVFLEVRKPTPPA